LGSRSESWSGHGCIGEQKTGKTERLSVVSSSEVLIPFQVGAIPFPVTKPILVMWCVSLTIVLGLSLANRSKLGRGMLVLLYDFVSQSFASSLKTNRKLWFSFLVSTFLFVLGCNLSGLVPLSEAPTSSLSVTAGLALLVFAISHAVGFICHGPSHIKHIVPAGIPMVMVLFMFVLELISQLARPLSLSIRLFANLFAGHQVLLIFLGLIASAAPFIKLLPFAGVVLLSMFEIFVSFIQAFIFTYLASFYISDAAHGAH